MDFDPLPSDCDFRLRISNRLRYRASAHGNVVVFDLIGCMRVVFQCWPAATVATAVDRLDGDITIWQAQPTRCRCCGERS